MIFDTFLYVMFPKISLIAYLNLFYKIEIYGYLKERTWMKISTENDYIYMYIYIALILFGQVTGKNTNFLILFQTKKWL